MFRRLLLQPDMSAMALFQTVIGLGRQHGDSGDEGLDHVSL
jgi:hypothetical protein